jgi:hypothetical protein
MRKKYLRIRNTALAFKYNLRMMERPTKYHEVNLYRNNQLTKLFLSLSAHSAHINRIHTVYNPG